MQSGNLRILLICLRSLRNNSSVAALPSIFSAPQLFVLLPKKGMCKDLRKQGKLMTFRVCGWLRLHSEIASVMSSEEPTSQQITKRSASNMVLEALLGGHGVLEGKPRPQAIGFVARTHFPRPQPCESRHAWQRDRCCRWCSFLVVFDGFLWWEPGCWNPQTRMPTPEQFWTTRHYRPSYWRNVLSEADELGWDGMNWDRMRLRWAEMSSDELREAEMNWAKLRWAELR